MVQPVWRLERVLDFWAQFGERLSTGIKKPRWEPREWRLFDDSASLGLIVTMSTCRSTMRPTHQKFQSSSPHI